jgi:hypothetical protein
MCRCCLNFIQRTKDYRPAWQVGMCTGHAQVVIFDGRKHRRAKAFKFDLDATDSSVHYLSELVDAI